ncbi:MAG: hypothetical protein O7F75_13905 [Alphaproteobacteria bacterium]|nr:hypothetical protein [Alphaproteobacteria bacterium]
MAKLTVFEIHTLREGTWKIDSIFDDRELAVMEGERLGRSQRFELVRVVEETFDEETERVGTHTIYRSAREQQQTDTTDTKESPSAEVLEASRRSRLSASRTPPPPEVLEELHRRRLSSTRTPPKKSMVKQFLGRAILLAAIMGIALGLVYILNSIF